MKKLTMKTAKTAILTAGGQIVSAFGTCAQVFNLCKQEGKHHSKLISELFDLPKVQNGPMKGKPVGWQALLKLGQEEGNAEYKAIALFSNAISTYVSTYVSDGEKAFAYKPRVGRKEKGKDEKSGKVSDVTDTPEGKTIAKKLSVQQSFLILERVANATMNKAAISMLAALKEMLGAE